MILQHLDCDGLKSLGRFIPHFGPADPRQALIGKWLGNTHSHKLHLKRTQNFYTICYGTSGTSCTLKKLRYCRCLFVMQMNRVVCRSHKFINNILAFILCLTVFFGIASEATAALLDCRNIGCPQPTCKGQKCTCTSAIRGCLYDPYNGGSCKCNIRSSSEYDQDPVGPSSSPNSDPLAPSSGVVAPSIGNPAP